jgi:hypothetical protein
MIKDKTGRPWKLRFRRSRYGWTWDARWNNYGQRGGYNVPFATKELAETDAQREVASGDAVADIEEFFRRLMEEQDSRWRREAATKPDGAS